ncbi:hypothetical protein TYRP_001959 [Tyrophagus putrescentiae]|nr:hypothetical protein TYRP_001959 [Tyrophagus putrescentiae]
MQLGSFFGRTYNNLNALGECKNNGECVINKKNRTSCKSCRLKKCLMVGMSKSGSRYGRRSNWFKIHCLIQDQQEMSNRMVEASKNGGLGLGLGDDHKNSGVLGGADTKDFMAKYKENEMRNSNSVSGVSITSSDHPLNNSNSSNNNNNLGSHHNHHHHHPLSSGSPRLNSPNSSSEGGSSMGRVSVSSPYSSLFEAAKVPAFPSPYLSASASLGPSMAAAAAVAANHHQQKLSQDFQKEFNNLASRFNPAAAAAAAAAAAGLTSLSTPTISPLSPLNAAVSRLFLQNSNVNSLLGKRFSDLQSAEQLLQASRFLPLQAAALNSVLKHQQQQQQQQHRAAVPAAVVDLSPKRWKWRWPLRQRRLLLLRLPPEFYGSEVPEQERPIDLSVKRLDEYKLELQLLAESGSKCLGKAVPGDHDSGFSPSSNEDTHNTSPLDLTAPAKRGRPGSGGSSRVLSGSFHHSLVSGGRSHNNHSNHRSHHRGGHLSGSANSRNHHHRGLLHDEDEDEEEEEVAEEEDEHVDVEEDEGDEMEDNSDVEVHDQLMDTSSSAAADRVTKTEIECAP